MKNENLKEKWINIFQIIVEPEATTPYVLAAVLVCFYYNTGDESSRTLLAFLFSIVSGVIGGIYSKKWSDLNDEKVLRARAISAIRSLKLLFQQIVSVETRTKSFIKKDNNGLNEELINNQYEETIDRCKLLKEHTIGAIENWHDIIPEADIKTQIGIFDGLKRREVELEEKVEQNEENKKELEKIRVQIREIEQRLNQSGLSGIASGSFSSFSDKPEIAFMTPSYDLSNAIITYEDQETRCKKCGNLFYTSNEEEKCPDCRNKSEK